MRLTLLFGLLIIADAIGFKMSDDSSSTFANIVLFVIAWAALFDVIHAFKRRGEG